MQRTIRSLRNSHPPLRLQRLSQLRTAATTAGGKPEGTIADSFASLSGQQFEALEPRFAAVKDNLIRGNEHAVKASWDRLLLTLKDEVLAIKQLGHRLCLRSTSKILIHHLSTSIASTGKEAWR